MIRKLTINEVTSNDSSITKAVVVDVTTLTVKVFGDGDQIAYGGSSPNVGEELCTLVLEAHFPKGLQLLVHVVDLRLEVGEIGRVRETILDVDLG